MASTNLKNLAVHLEKIAYGAAAVLALFILISPTVFTSKLYFTDLEEGKARVEARRVDSIELPPIRDVEKALAKQWAVTVPGAATPWISPWTTEVRPAVLQLVETTGPRMSKHEPGTIAKIVPGRSAERRGLFLHVEAERGSISEGGRIARATLQRQVLGPEPKDWADLKEFGPEGPIAIDDGDVQAGGTYAYRLVTEAEAGEGAVLQDADKVKTSEPLAITDPLPYEYRVRIITAIPFDPIGKTDAALNGEISYWDYAKGAVVKSPKAAWKEHDTFGTEDEFEIALIELNKVTVKDKRRVDRVKLSTVENDRTVALPPPVTPESVRAAAEALKAAEEEAKAAEEAEASVSEGEAAEEEEEPVEKTTKTGKTSKGKTGPPDDEDKKSGDKKTGPRPKVR